MKSRIQSLFTKFRTITIIVLTIPAVLLAQQGTIIIRDRATNRLADVTTFNALKVALYDSAGTGITAATNPCDGVLGTTVPISLTADTVVISASSAKKNYICGMVIVAGAAEIVSITEGTGSTCATNETAIIGSTTDANGMSFAANGGASFPSTIFGSGTNVDTCLNVSGSNRVSGFLTYVQQ